LPLFFAESAESAEGQRDFKIGANVRSREIFSKKFFPKILEDDEDDEDALNLRSRRNFSKKFFRNFWALFIPYSAFLVR
jgi:hypothetical protein